MQFRWWDLLVSGGRKAHSLKRLRKKKGGFGFGFALRRSQSVREKQSDGRFQAGQYFTRPVSNGRSRFDFWFVKENFFVYTQASAWGLQVVFLFLPRKWSNRRSGYLFNFKRGRFEDNAPFITLKPLMIWPPKLHKIMYSSFPTSKHYLINTTTKYDVIMTSFCWIYCRNPNFQSRIKK